MVVVAIGSRLMKDDSVGVRVAERIQEGLNNIGIHVAIAETDYEFAKDALCDDSHAIILDAICSNKKPGEVTMLPLRDIGIAGTRPFTQHAYSLIDHIELTPGFEGCLIGIEAAELGYGLELSEQLASLFDNICDAVERMIIDEHACICQV